MVLHPLNCREKYSVKRRHTESSRVPTRLLTNTFITSTNMTEMTYIISNIKAYCNTYLPLYVYRRAFFVHRVLSISLYVTHYVDLYFCITDA